MDADANLFPHLQAGESRSEWELAVPVGSDHAD